ncbi:class-II fumarase/aspartase family protein [Pelagibacterium limicola]|uniref:class-II fumarase/aspartase family protein n=1 Tax=Pelagibacterium limicola TaxID=2791022 RepID=UPI0018AF6055|nr:adenylosuccinate lyase family protein [Pelagibacterium limicola]
MPSTLLDSDYYRDQYSAGAMRAVFSDTARYRSWLDVEVALARAQADLGLIPQEAAQAIAAAAKVENLDIVAMKIEFDRAGFAIMPLVRQLGKAAGPDAARFVHWGSTTQDILDTGLVLQMRAGLDLIAAELDAVCIALAALARTHRNSVMAGRTFMQQAAPITFGYKAAIWLDEMLRHRERLPQIRARLEVVQCGGAVGTLATIGEKALAMRKRQAEILGLGDPAISWHNARDGFTETVFWLGLVTASLGKFATEIATLMRTEVGEVREPYETGRGASSTMPQKRNPIACPQVIAIAALLREKTASQMTAMIQEHERAVAGMPIEWMVIPEAFLLASGAFKHMRPVLEGLEVDTARMRANLEGDGGLIMAESVMMGLAPHIGRNAAHELVFGAAQTAIAQNTTLRAQLETLDELKEYLAAGQLDSLLDPANYTGAAPQMVDTVLNRAQEQGLSAS